MQRTDIVIIGGGQAGLAMSHCLTRAGIDHVVLERRRVGERWRSERWDSLKLLTPNRMNHLPGPAGRDNDWDGGPEGFASARDVAAYLETYAGAFAAPILCHTTVLRVCRHHGDYLVETDRGKFISRGVVVATGDCCTPRVPSGADRLPARIRQIVPSRYRRPDGLPEGGVLVVGASASGIQIADELQRSGRAVTLAVGRHTRLPRRYRGRDIFDWLEAAGVLDERIDRVRDPQAARRQPSLQLVGSADGRSIDLGMLQDTGVRLAGRVTGMDGRAIGLAGDLALRAARADAKLTRLLARIDRHIDASGEFHGLPPAERLAPVQIGPGPDRIDLTSGEITAIVWATGYRRRYPWLQVPVLDAAGEIRHERGITPAAGLYVLGLRFLRRRKSTFIGGVGRDACELTVEIRRFLRAGAAPLAA